VKGLLFVIFSNLYLFLKAPIKNSELLLAFMNLVQETGSLETFLCC